MKSVSTAVLTCLRKGLLFYREEGGMPKRHRNIGKMQRTSKNLEMCLAQEIPEPGIVHGKVLRESFGASS